ncbi:MAG: ParB/RepB/Spo0J family partition protein [Holosporales bacterium]|jgi:ParB family chromosome partitioning protein|nr:ParB/RepB/Spo0J family partition protein [Holosporales bacterium]
MADKNNLGRGLESIFKEMSDNSSDSSIVAVELDIASVVPNPNQPRKSFDDASMQELIASVKQEGILQPILVRKLTDEEYQIIAGERRWRAALGANLRTIPAVTIECDETTALQLGLIENLQRDGLAPLEEAVAIKSLLDDCQRTQEDVAQMLSKSKSYVSNMIRLLKLPESIQKLLSEKKISAGHARAILEADDPNEIARKIIQNNLSVRDTEALVRHQRSSPTSGDHERSSDFIAIEYALADFLKARVKIYSKGIGGCVQIYFDDFNKLDDIVSLVSNRTRSDFT